MNRVAVACLLLGFCLLVAGAALIYHPLGFLTAGAGLIYAPLRKQGKKETK